MFSVSKDCKVASE